MKCGIYQITNKINNKKYIGQSIDIENRLKNHKRLLIQNKHTNIHLQYAWNKYGQNNFTFSIIKCCKKQYLNRFEKLFIKIFNTYENGYNQTIGGESLFKKQNPFYQKKHDEKTRNIMSKNHADFSGNRHPYYRHDLDNNIIVNLFKNGFSQKEIAKKLNTNRMTISRRLKVCLNQDEYNKISKKNKSKLMKGIKNHFFGKKHCDESRKKISKNHFDCSGHNHPLSKYSLWDSQYCSYKKNIMYRNSRIPNPNKCFCTVFKGHFIPIGYFHDFISCEIIGKIIEENKYESKN